MPATVLIPGCRFFNEIVSPPRTECSASQPFRSGAKRLLDYTDDAMPTISLLSFNQYIVHTDVAHVFDPMRFTRPWANDGIEYPTSIRLLLMRLAPLCRNTISWRLDAWSLVFYNVSNARV